MVEISTNIFKSLVVEMRPRIQSVNVFGKMANCNTELNVNLLENSFQFIANDETINVNLSNISAVSNSLSPIKITDDFVIFKFATNNAYGSYKSELLQHPKHNHDSKLHETFLSRGKCYTFKCINCTNILSDEVYFTRVLPLPSEITEPSEWFCHPTCSNANMTMTPKVTDIFYTHCYVDVNSHIMKNTKSSNQVIVCGRCLCWIGIKKNSATMRLWFNTVGVVHGSNCYKTNPLNDVWSTIKDIFKHKLLTSAKFIFTCKNTMNKTDYILIWIIEKKLSLLLGIFDDSINSPGSGKLKISETDVAKVLFKYQETKTSLVDDWLNDAAVSTVSVSKPMIHALTRHLHKYNKLFSEEYNNSNGYLISYLCMY